MPVGNEISVSSYQNLDGSNTTLALYCRNYKPCKNLSLTGGAGSSTSFNGTNSFVLEGKAKYNINKHVNFQARLRNSFSSQKNISQLRLSGGYKTDIANNTSIYVTPYAAAKYNYQDGSIATDIGAFAGVTQNLSPNLSVSAEVQKYNDFKPGSENWGINAILSYTF